MQDVSVIGEPIRAISHRASIAKSNWVNIGVYPRFSICGYLRLLDSSCDIVDRHQDGREEHTDAETAQQLNAAGHRSGEGKPFTSAIVVDLRRAHALPSHAERLRGKGLLTKDEITQRLGVHPTTIKNWHRAGLLPSHKANDKNERLYQPPTPGDPRLVARQGSPINKRVPTQPAPGGAL